MGKQTKQKLANSLKDLTSKKSIKKITIEDIATRAGLKRKSFYYHFNDIYELISWTYMNDIIKDLKQFSTLNDWQDMYIFIDNYILENKKFIMATYELSSLSDLIHEQTYNIILNILNNVQDEKLNKNDRRFIAKFYSHAFVGILGDWIKNGMKEDPEAMIKSMDKLIKIQMENRISWHFWTNGQIWSLLFRKYNDKITIYDFIIFVNFNLKQKLK